MHAVPPDDRSLAEQLRAVPMPPQLVDRLRAALVPSDEQLDARLKAVDLPLFFVNRLKEIPEDALLDEQLRAIAVPPLLVAGLKRMPVQVQPATPSRKWQRRLASLTAAVALSWLVMLAGGGAFAWWFENTVASFDRSQHESLVVLDAPLQMEMTSALAASSPEFVTISDRGSVVAMTDEVEPWDMLQVESPIDPNPDRIGPVGELFASMRDGMRPWANVVQLKFDMLGSGRDERDDVILEQPAILPSQGIEPPLAPGYDRSFFRKHHVFPPLFPAVPELARLSLPLEANPANFDYLERQALTRRRVDPRIVRVEDFVAHALGFVPAARTGEIEMDVAGALSPFGPKDTRLLQCVVKAGATANARPAHIVVALDLSTSMRQHWPEIQRTLLMLPERLGPEDRLSLVAFAEDVQLSLEALTSSDWALWREHIRRLQPEGSADIAEGVRESLTVAFNTSNLPGNLQKELIFISDHEGVWGSDGLGTMASLLKEGTSAGVQTSVIDFATPREDRHTCLGILAEAGGVKSFGIVNIGPRDDRQSPLHSWEQLRFQPIGSEVELSMEFNPQSVAAYRLVGHDAGSWAAVNHQAQPLEFRPGDARSAQVEIAFKSDNAEEIGRLNLQWRDPADGEIKLRQVRVLRSEFTRPWTEMPAWYQRSVVAAELAEVLRGSRQALRETNWTDGTAHDYARILEIVKKTSSELRNDPDTVRLIRAAEAWRRLSNR